MTSKCFLLHSTESLRMGLFCSNKLCHLSISVFLCLPYSKPVTASQSIAVGTTRTPKSAKLVFNTPAYSQREGIPGDRYCPQGSSWGGRGLGRSLFNFIFHRICTLIIRKVIHINCKNFGKFINIFKELYK